MKKVLKKLKESAATAIEQCPLHDDLLILTRIKVDFMDFRDNIRKNRWIRSCKEHYYNEEISEEMIWDELFRRAAETNSICVQ